MKLQKGVISLLAGLSVLASVIFTSCGNPSGAEKGNEKEGIVLSWEDMPENTKHIRIENWCNGRNYTVFEINDLSKYNSVTDEYVDEGKDYEYRIVYLDEDYRWIKASDWFTVKAEGGSGELSFSATATTDGIKLASSDIPENFEWIWAEKIEKNSKKSERIYIYQKDNDGSFTDKFVTAGMEYEYKLQVQVGYNSYTNNEGEKVLGTPLVEYPRFKTVNVTASAGSGSVEMKKLPAISYNADAKTMTLTQKPEFADNNIAYWYMNIEYYNGKNGNWSFADFDSEDSDENPSMQIKTVPDGLWNFNDCWFCLTFEKDGKSAFRYDFGIYDAPEIPQTIGLNVDNLFMPVTTSAKDGIKIEWSNLPDETKQLEIRDSKTNNILFKVNDLSKYSFVTDKYVTAGKTYGYYFVARNQSGDWIQQSETVPFVATAGCGELNFSGEGIETGNNLTASLPVNYDSLEIYKRKKEATGNWDSIIFYSTENNFPFIDKFVTKDVEYDYTLSIQIGKSKSWNNGVEIPADDVLEYPRYNSITVKAKGGAGEVKITNKPVATYADSKVTYTTEPVIGDFGQHDYWIEFNYCNEDDYHWSLYHYDTFNNDSSIATMNMQNSPAGEWKIDQYWITLYFDTYRYKQYSNDLSMLGGLPVITK